ncbi:MAG: diguanylate cyclase [Campylobacterales bacterium]|nr:diguanylate cyclase [Campylobacterales bacterium]
MPFPLNSRLAGFTVVLFSSAALITLLEIKNAREDIEQAKQHILKEAAVHYNNITVTRAWAAHFGGVFVRSEGKLKPNPYLKEMIDEAEVQTQTGETLIKINPAWMTRQLSEMTQGEDFSYRITSDHPINPLNRSVDFDNEAFAHLRNHPEEKVYYRFDEAEKKLHYMGGLYIEDSCLRCHDRTRYEIGDLRGGVSISLSTHHLDGLKVSLMQKSYVMIALIWAVHILLWSFFWMQERQRSRMKKLNQTLEEKVKARTQELSLKNGYLKTIFNLEQNLIFTVDRQWRLIDYNRACAEFFGTEKISALCQEHACLCNYFEPYESEKTESAGLKGGALISYMLEHQQKRLNVLLNWEEKHYIFELLVRPIEHSAEEHILVVMSDITKRQKKIESLEEATLTDPLTGAGNRMKFNLHFEQYFKTSERYKKEFSLILLDIDFFKKINDTYGHDTGDKVLVSLANIIRSRIRTSDVFCRWGGEEFVILMPMTTLDEAIKLAEQMKEAISNAYFEGVGHLTCSFGVASYRRSDSKEQLFKRLDEALYRAKKSGRNCVVSV